MKKKVQVIIKVDKFQEQKKGTIINVSRGYAFNYLIPKGIAETITSNKIKHFEMFLTLEKQKQEANSIAIENIKNKIAKVSKITLYRKKGEHKLIFGSIKEKDIINWLEKHTNIKLEKKQINLDNINTIGIYLSLIHI